MHCFEIWFIHSCYSLFFCLYDSFLFCMSTVLCVKLLSIKKTTVQPARYYRNITIKSQNEKLAFELHFPHSSILSECFNSRNCTSFSDILKKKIGDYGTSGLRGGKINQLARKFALSREGERKEEYNNKFCDSARARGLELNRFLSELKYMSP